MGTYNIRTKDEETTTAALGYRLSGMQVPKKISQFSTFLFLILIFYTEYLKSTPRWEEVFPDILIWRIGARDSLEENFAYLAPKFPSRRCVKKSNTYPDSEFVPIRYILVIKDIYNLAEPGIVQYRIQGTKRLPTDCGIYFNGWKLVYC